jgi:hypothetical protein
MILLGLLKIWSIAEESINHIFTLTFLLTQDVQTARDRCCAHRSQLTLNDFTNLVEYSKTAKSVPHTYLELQNEVESTLPLLIALLERVEENPDLLKPASQPIPTWIAQAIRWYFSEPAGQFNAARGT